MKTIGGKVFTHCFTFLVLVTIIVAPFHSRAEPLPDDSDGTYQKYTLLAPSVIGKAPGENVTFEEYLALAYKAFLLALVAIGILSLMYSGFTYILTESISVKSAAREHIIDIFIALALALGSVLILQTINPALVTFDLGKIAQ